MAGIEHHFQTNGLDEKMNQTVTKAIMKYLIPEQDDWDEHIDAFSLSHKYTCINKLYTILLDVCMAGKQAFSGTENDRSDSGKLHVDSDRVQSYVAHIEAKIISCGWPEH